MPKIQWKNLPPALRDHLVDRLRERDGRRWNIAGPRGLIRWKGVSSFAGEDQSTQSHMEAPVPALSER